VAIKPSVPARGDAAFTEATSNTGPGCACAEIAVIPSKVTAKLTALIVFFKDCDFGFTDSTFVHVLPSAG
jgi:hypothetical protein